MTQESPDPPLPRRRFRKWLKRGLLALLVLVGLLVAFHRPILLGIIRWVTPKAAAARGVELDWQVKGSVLNDLQITAMKATAAEDHWLQRALIGHAALQYDLRAMLKGEREHALQSVMIHNADAELDLRQLPKKAKEAIEQEPKRSGPRLMWPKTIDLKNVTATITLANGRHLFVKGLTFQAGEGMPGLFACEELRLEPGGVELKNLTAQVQWEPRKITIKNLTLPKDIVLEQLVADLTGWETNGIALTAAARLGAARFDVDVKGYGMAEAAQQFEAKIQGHNLRAEELRVLGLPKDVRFDGGTLSLHVTGDPKNTLSLQGGAQVTADNIRAGGTRLDHVEFGVDLDQGIALLKSAKATRAGNLIEATGRAELPPSLVDWRKIRWQGQASGTITDVNQILIKPPALKGEYKLQATAEGLGTTPTKVTSELNAAALVFGNYKLPQLSSAVALEGKLARFDIPDLQLGAGNSGSIKASMDLQGEMPVEAEWTVSITNPDTFFAATGLKPPPNRVQGNLQTKGHAKFNVRDFNARDFTRLVADISLNGHNIKYGEDQLQSLELKTRAENGRLTVGTLAVRVDDKNGIQLTGSAELKAPFVFDVNSAISLPELKALNTLLKNFKAPPIDSGSLFAKVAGQGQFRPWQYTGSASLTATKVRTARMPEAADVVLAASFEGKRANLTQLEATLGPWKAGVKGVVDDKQADLAELKVWQNKTLLLNGRAKVPFDVLKTSTGDPMDVNITAKDLRVNEILAAAGIKDIPAGVLDAEIHLQGRLETAAGTAHVTLKDVKSPKAPKSFQPATAVLDVTLAGKQAKALLTVVQPPLQTVTVTAEVPLNIVHLAKNPGKFQNTPIKAHLDMPETDIGFLREYAPDRIRNLPGKMRIQADISGTVKEPVIEAAADLKISEIGWVKTDLPSVRDVQVRIRAHDRKIRVEDISAILAGGRVKIAGDVDATNFKEPTVSLKVNAYEALIFRDPTTSLRANANLSCEGTLKAARVSGLVEFVRGRIFKEIDLTPELSLPSDVPPLPPDTQRREARLPIPEMLKDWTFDVAVKTHDPILIAGNLANGAFSIDASLFGTGAVPVISGGGTIDRLYLKLPYSIVKITKGVITLNPEKPMDPALDLRGESRVGNHDITLYVYGDSSAPKTRFTSIPPMSEADIVTLLATGTTLSGSSSEAAAEAASRALMVYVTDFYRKIFRKKKVVRTEPPRLHITFNPAAASSTNTNVSDSVQVTYDLNQFWRIRGGYAQTGRVRGFLAYVFRFGEAAVAVDEEEDRPNLVRKLGPGAQPPPPMPKAPQKGIGTSSAAPAVRSR